MGRRPSTPRSAAVVATLALLLGMVSIPFTPFLPAARAGSAPLPGWHGVATVSFSSYTSFTGSSMNGRFVLEQQLPTDQAYGPIPLEVPFAAWTAHDYLVSQPPVFPGCRTDEYTGDGGGGWDTVESVPGLTPKGFLATTGGDNVAGFSGGPMRFPIARVGTHIGPWPVCEETPTYENYYVGTIQATGGADSDPDPCRHTSSLTVGGVETTTFAMTYTPYPGEAIAGCLASDDADGDGLSDNDDNCPATFNPDQKDANRNGVGDACDQPDADLDKVPDSTDQCSGTPVGAPVNAVGCPDTDKDGVHDNSDVCPGTPVGAPVNAVGCPDTDKDGVSDDKDKCPSTPAGARVNVDGCEVPTCGWDFTSTASPSLGNRTVTFTSTAPVGSSVVWDFGDGLRSTELSPRHVYASHGQYTATLVGSSSTCNGYVRKVVVSDPVTTYAPWVQFAKGETHWPMDPDAFVSSSSLYFANPNATSGRCPTSDALIVPQGKVRAASLARGTYSYRFCTGVRTRRGVSTYSTRLTTAQVTSPSETKGKPAVPGRVSGRWGLYLNLDDRRWGGVTPKTSTYPNAPRMAVEYKAGRYVTYWFFSARNYVVSTIRISPVLRMAVRDVHEGDWERIAVNLDASGRATEVGYWQHYCNADIHTWDTMTRDAALIDGTHPRVYVALGAHASYHKPGYTPVACGPVPGGVNDSHRGGGVTWRTWAKGASSFYEATKQPWYGFGGGWGSKTPAGTTPYPGPFWGPLGPGPKKPPAPKDW